LENVTEMQYLPGLLIFVSAWVHGAALWQGTVAYVTDGDTLWVRPSSAELDDKSARKIRIEGIDAPEVCQAYGEQSKTALKQRLLQQKVTIHSRRVDDYGHAWSYHYRHSAGPYAAQEHEARSGKRGLFAAPAPVEPRVFRRTHGSCHTPRN
jgi:micrococcal nuclease